MREIDFGRNLREIREGKDLSLQALADIAGLSKTYLFGLEHGRHSPSLDTLTKLATALSVSVISLVGNEHPERLTAGLQEENERLREQLAQVRATLENGPDGDQAVLGPTAQQRRLF